MPFCTQCAHAIPDGARFCPACGAPVAAAAHGPPPAPAPPEPALSQSPTRTAATGKPPTPVSTSSSGQHGRFDPGTRLGTRYRIVALLGRGGMGEVYRADDLELGQSVALKFLPIGVAANPAELARFRGEVRVARLIAHPNVCRVYDIGEADGHIFLSMEYIDGEDLASVLRRMGRPTSDKAIEIARQICLGLAAAHEAGMLHRDLKPANVMIDGRGRARITDFGLAGLAVELAREGQLAGTPTYMAPEQLDGGRVSVRSDLYSLGLVLYELFTGKRVFDVTTMAELRRMHDSSSITTPSELTRDIDPAVERVILHCLERDPEARPPSAYAVLGALPGGDPLAAALAAGETPSPELVANAGERGTQSLGVIGACVAAGLAGIAMWAGVLGPEFRPLTQPSQVLSVRAADLMSRIGAFEALPKHSAEGFDLNQTYVKHLRTDRAEREQKHSAVYFWRRWSPRLIEAPNIHNELVALNNPSLIAAGEAAVMFDPAGRLIGLRAIPPDSVPAANGGRPVWSVLWTAAGLDSSTFTPAPLARPVPAMCDSAAAWSGPLPWSGGERVTVQMGASRGRLTHFTIAHDWGTTTAPLDSTGADIAVTGDWAQFIFTLLPLIASIYFGIHNLRLRRGDWRGATRIALWVFAMNMLEAVFTTRISEIGLIGAGWDWVDGRALGHSLIHSVTMWFAYVALEPYVRRLWPRMLVSWTRLLSGRARDPLVGRDVLVGVAAGSGLTAVVVGGAWACARFGLTQVPTQLNGDILTSLTSLANTACSLSYAGSVCVLIMLQTLVMVLLARLILRRTSLAVAIAVLVVSTMQATGLAPTTGWPLALIGALIPALGVLILMQFGLVAGAVAAFVTLVASSTVASFNLSSWYADRALLPAALLVTLLAYGAVTALAGKSILGDPLKEPAGK
jgi:serine/threonine-protein kinase